MHFYRSVNHIAPLIGIIGKLVQTGVILKEFEGALYVFGNGIAFLVITSVVWSGKHCKAAVFDCKRFEVIVKFGQILLCFILEIVVRINTVEPVWKRRRHSVTPQICAEFSVIILYVVEGLGVFGEGVIHCFWCDACHKLFGQICDSLIIGCKPLCNNKVFNVFFKSCLNACIAVEVCGGVGEAVFIKSKGKSFFLVYRNIFDRVGIFELVGNRKSAVYVIYNGQRVTCLDILY